MSRPKTQLADPAFQAPVVTDEARLPSLVLIGALYVAQGLPMGFTFEALPVLLRAGGVSLEMIALLPLAGLPWILKLLWAPLVDNHWIASLGRRRSWILTMQSLLVLAMALIALLPLSDAMVPWLVLLVLLGSLASATQDTATDGLAAETLRGSALAWANALQVGGMMAGFMIGGAGLLILSDVLGYQAAVGLIALLLLLASLPAILWKEPAGAPEDKVERASIRGSFGRRAVWPLLLVALCYGTLHSGAMSLSKLMLTDGGWSLGGVGGIAAVAGLSMILLGSPLGSWLTARHGIWLSLVAGLLVVGVSLLFWLLLASGSLPSNVAVSSLATLLLGAGGGIAAVAASTLAMRFAGEGQQAGTDVTILQSAHVLGEMLASAAAVGLAAAVGYATTFTAGLASLVLLLLVVRWASRLEITRPYALPKGR